MDKIVVFQCEDKNLKYYEVGDKILDVLASSLESNSYVLISDNRYDPDWPIRVKKENQEFIVVITCLRISPTTWCISLEDLEYHFLDNIKIQTNINPIIQETLNNFPNVNNIVWYEDFNFLK